MNIAQERPFIHNKERLVNLYTQPNHLDYTQDKLFTPDGRKAVEVFTEDIKNNLTRWSFDKKNKAIFYETRYYWYILQAITQKNTTVILITQYKDGSFKRSDTWMNLNSCIIGRDWLMKNHPDKYTKLVGEER